MTSPPGRRRRMAATPAQPPPSRYLGAGRGPRQRATSYVSDHRRAITANTLVKGGLAWVGGGRRFGADIAAVFAAAMAVGAVLALYPLLV